MTLFLIDASHYQSTLPVPSLRGQGFVALIAKATQGRTWTDPKFDDWTAQAKQAGLLFAAYHYLEPDNEAAQAAHTAAVVPPDIPVWVDVEGGATRDQGYAYAEALRAAGRIVAGLYNASQPTSSYGWWRAAYGIDPTGTASYAYAANGGDRSSKWTAGTIRHPDIWQFCQHGRVAGYSGDVDLNAYRGTLDELVATGWFWVPTALRTEEDPLAAPDQDALDAIARAVVDEIVARKVVTDDPNKEPDAELRGRTIPGLAMMAARRAGTAATASVASATRVLPAPDVNEAQLAAQLAPLLAPAIGQLGAVELQALVDGISTETAQKLADLLTQRLAS